MERIRRQYDADEIVETFLDFFERTGEIPEIHIGTDSQKHTYRRTKVFKFVTMVLLYHNSFLPELRVAKTWGRKSYERQDMFQDERTGKMRVKMRMITEAQMTFEIAEQLVEKGIDRDIIVIGLDVNDDDAHESHKALDVCRGLFVGCGYPRVEWKPDSMITYAADRLSK